jgi:hypothetical protein
MPPRNRRNVLKTAPAPEVEEDSSISREPGEMHELFAEYLNEEYDAGVTPRQVMLFTSKRNEFRSGEAYREYRARRKEALGSKADDEPEAKPTKSRRVPAKTKPVEEDKPQRRQRTVKKKSDPEGEGTAKVPAAGRRRSTPPKPPAVNKPPVTRRAKQAAGKAAEVATVTESTEEDPKPTRRRRTPAAKPAPVAKPEPVEEDSSNSEPEATETTPENVTPIRRRRRRPGSAPVDVVNEPF